MDKHAAPIRDLLWIMWMGYAAYAIGLWAFGVEGSR